MLALLDFDEFHDLLLDATREMLIGLREEYLGQQLYAFYLFHDPLWGFILPQVAIDGGIQLLPKFDLKRSVKLLVNAALRIAPQSNVINHLSVYHDYSIEKSDWQFLNIKRNNKQTFAKATTIGREYFEAVNMWL